MQQIILFDGICNLCSGAVGFVIRHDPAGKFKFAALQSESGKQLLEKHVPNDLRADSFVLIKDGKPLLRSAAAMEVIRQLSGPVKLLYVFIIVPTGLRNLIYDFVAGNRFKWFGKKEACMTPQPDNMNRFIS